MSYAIPAPLTPYRCGHRYVYQPMEELYLLLITNKASNIIEDLDTLRLLSKGIVPYHSPTLPCLLLSY